MVKSITQIGGRKEGSGKTCPVCGVEHEKGHAHEGLTAQAIMKLLEEQGLTTDGKGEQVIYETPVVPRSTRIRKRE